MGSYFSTQRATDVNTGSQELKWSSGQGPIPGTRPGTDGLPPKNELAIGKRLCACHEDRFCIAFHKCKYQSYVYIYIKHI